MARTGLRDRALAALGALLLLIALPVACFALRSVGPATRVVFYEYLPLVELAMYAFAAAVGAAVGWDVARWLRARSVGQRLPYVRLAGLALLGFWVVAPQLLAFPASASVAERDAWARGRLAQYAALTRVIAAVPQVQADVGQVNAMAPTANDQHVGAREMNGDDMRFTLEVVGSHGAGTFHADCTLDDYRVYHWRSGRWIFAGRETRIDHVPERVPAQ